MKKLLEFLEIISMTIVILGATIVMILEIFFTLSMEILSSITLALIGSLGLYLLASHKLMEDRIKTIDRL